MQDTNASPLVFKGRAEQRVEALHGEEIGALLHRLYFDERLTQEQVADRLGIGRSTVIRWFTKYGLEGRHPREAVA